MASKGVNRMILLGNVGQDPEVRSFSNGGCVCNLSIATSESWKDKQTGEQKEVTEWHRVAIHGKLAEIAGEYLKKGSQVYIEGQLKTRKWQDQSGADRYTTEIVVQGFNGVMQMIGSAPGGNSKPQQQNAGWGQPQQPQASNQGHQPAPNANAGSGTPPKQQGFNEPDDIPF